MSLYEKKFLEALHDFLCMARYRPQTEVLKYFLDQVVEHSDLCKGGAILVYLPHSREDGGDGLKVWDRQTEIDDLKTFGKLKVAVPPNQGISTVAFHKRAPEFASVACKHPQYWTNEKNKNHEEGPMYCVPILLHNRMRREPFGVVAFTNPPEKKMEEEDRNKMNLAVKALEAMMSLSPLKLVEERKIFIVHGRDEEFRKQLVDILEEQHLTPVVIQSMARTGADLLGFLEEQIRNCLAGFILLTPDDEGRLYKYGERFSLRARQNVIFEGGYLTALFRETDRICFLQKGEMEIPSDLNGLLMEKVTGAITSDRITLTLQSWGLLPGSDSTQKATGAAPEGNALAEREEPAPQAEPGGAEVHPEPGMA